MKRPKAKRGQQCAECGAVMLKDWNTMNGDPLCPAHLLLAVIDHYQNREILTLHVMSVLREAREKK